MAQEIFRQDIYEGRWREAARQAAEVAAFQATDEWPKLLNSGGIVAPVMSQKATRRESLYEDDL